MATCCFTVAILTNCASRQEYAAFVVAGSKYAGAIDELAATAAALQVESTSWSLIGDATDAPAGTNLLRIYEGGGEDDIAKMKELSKTQEHARLLAKYFTMLEQLSASDAPERTKVAITETVTQLSDLNVPIPNGQAIGDIAALAIDAHIQGALREEFKNRQILIRKELELQSLLIAALADDIKRAQERIKKDQEFTTLYTPFSEKKALAKPEDWVTKRQSLYIKSQAVTELVAAQQASIELKKIFEALIVGEVSLARINALIDELNRIVDVAEKIN